MGALRARDPAAARPLWTRFAPMVFGVLGRILGPRVPLEDAVQEVFLRVFRGRRRLRSEADLRLQVLSASARVAYLCLRMGSSRWPRWATRWRPAHLPGTDRPGSREAAALSRFYRVLDDLSATDRIAFVLRFIEGLELREVAAAVGRPATWLEPRLAWALAKVTRAIERDPALLRFRRPARGVIAGAPRTWARGRSASGGAENGRPGRLPGGVRRG